MAAASTSLSSCPLFSTTTLSSRPQSTVPRCVGLPPPTHPARLRDAWKNVGYCRKITRKTIPMAVGDIVTSVEPTVEGTVTSAEPTVEETTAPAEPTVNQTSAPAQPTNPETPNEEPLVQDTTASIEIVKNIQDAWDKLDDKYAVSALVFAGFVGLVGTAGLISAVDRIPVLPGIMELIGIGYSGWFAYNNLTYKNSRDGLLAKIKCTYEDITGTSI